MGRLRTRPDVAAILEAAYAPDGDDERWLAGVLRAAAPRLDTGGGVMGFAVRFEHGEHRYLASILEGGDEAWRRDWRTDWWEPFMARIDTASVRALLEFGPVSSASLLWEGLAAAHPTLDTHLRALEAERRAPKRPAIPNPGFRFPDSLNVCALEGGGSAIGIVANRAQPIELAELAAVRSDLARLSSHLASALRLRRRLGRAVSTGDADVILDPRTGAVLHAAAGRKARELDALQQAARDVDRARSGVRRYSADEALGLWRCLVEGRWTLADVFESDGRRYVVAIPNAPESSAPVLSDREAQVLHLASFGRANKEIAYELGLAPSTVATLLGRAARKLGVSGPAALIVRARAMRLAAGRDAAALP